MRVHVVSDIHGNAEALLHAAQGADALVVLGDLLNLVDYQNFDQGILGTLFGAEKVAVFARLRREGKPSDVGDYLRSLWGALENPHAALEEAAHAQYEAVFTALKRASSGPIYATPGNVDLPELWSDFLDDRVQMLDGEVAEIGGLRFGFVGGGMLSGNAPIATTDVWRPYLRSNEDFAAAVSRLTEIDVLGSHIPPAWPELTYDVVARRAERGAASLQELILDQQPRWSLFGHVHQPLASRARVGRTECRNVGHFQKTERPYVLRW